MTTCEVGISIPMIMAVESGQDGVFGVRKLVWWLPAWQLSHSPNNHLLVRNPPRNKLRKDSFLDFPTIECGIFLVTLLNFDHLIKVTVAFSLGPPTEWAESLSGIVLCILYVTDSRSKKSFLFDRTTFTFSLSLFEQEVVFQRWPLVLPSLPSSSPARWTRSR